MRLEAGILVGVLGGLILLGALVGAGGAPLGSTIAAVVLAGLLLNVALVVFHAEWTGQAVAQHMQKLDDERIRRQAAEYARVQHVEAPAR